MGTNGASEKSRFIKATLDYMRREAHREEKALIVSENSFPTSSGMASSASGAAALVCALSDALGLGLKEKQLSLIARRISGSACRSIYGGIVKWRRGSERDGSDSYAIQVASEGHWPGLLDVIAVVDASKKRISSSEGHSLTVSTSVLYKSRPIYAEKNVKAVEAAIKEKNFDRMADIIMRDSNNMHATMLDTWPPIMYLNDVSREIIHAVHGLNQSAGSNIAAYTFDAGPNAHIITTSGNRAKILDMLHNIGGVNDIIEARMGKGPATVRTSLIDTKNLRPLKRSQA
jgi:diphosphomevalonate decarboxylase